jgi:uncharacterized protein with HEPN domain
MNPSTRPYFARIQRALGRIEEYLPTTEADFLNQPMAQDAILMRLQEIGEVLARIRRIAPDLFARPEHDAWNKLIALRNIISHGYDGIEMHRIWQILTVELPPFADTIDRAIISAE